MEHEAQIGKAQMAAALQGETFCEAAAESERELVVDEAGECATAVAEEAVAETELKTSP